jgi:predicted transcriptional regulator
MSEVEPHEVTRGKNLEIITTRVPTDMRADVKHLAASENVSMHEFVRRAIAERVLRIDASPVIEKHEKIAEAIKVGLANPVAVAAVAEVKPHVIEHAKNAQEWLGFWIESLEHGVAPGAMSSHECFLQFREQVTAAVDLSMIGARGALQALESA